MQNLAENLQKTVSSGLCHKRLLDQLLWITTQNQSNEAVLLCQPKYKRTALKPQLGVHYKLLKQQRINGLELVVVYKKHQKALGLCRKCNRRANLIRLVLNTKRLAWDRNHSSKATNSKLNYQDDPLPCASNPFNSKAKKTEKNCPHIVLVPTLSASPLLPFLLLPPHIHNQSFQCLWRIPTKRKTLRLCSQKVTNFFLFWLFFSLFWGSHQKVSQTAAVGRLPQFFNCRNATFTYSLRMSN